MGAPVGVAAGVEAGVTLVLVRLPAVRHILGNGGVLFGGVLFGGFLFSGDQAEEARDPVDETGVAFVVGFVLVAVIEGEEASPSTTATPATTPVLPVPPRPFYRSVMR
jgi:hypothetical protein